jgi:hypothetical protein
MSRPSIAALVLLAAGSAWAQDPGPDDFAWRARLEVPAQATLARVPLPGEALMQLQSPHADDLRLFDSAGQPVPFSLANPPLPKPAPRARTLDFRALPLATAAPGARPPKGSVQVRVDDNGQRQSFWVQLAPARGTDAAPAEAKRLPSALFDTRKQKEPVAAFALQGRWPLNVPVRVTLSTSDDLANWTPVDARGRIFRFEGEGAPANDVLELTAPLHLEGRYLRVDWGGQEGVRIDTVTGLLPAPAARVERPAAVLPAARADGPSALEWSLGFATPIAQLELVAGQPNTLVPVRILGRNQPSEPWRLLGQAVVYRLGTPGQESTGTPAVLQRPSVRWLRVESTHGTRLEEARLSARALFDPVDVVFVAGRPAPYQLAGGRAATRAGALPLAMLSTTTPTRLDDLPRARISEMKSTPAEQPVGWLPRGVDGKTAGLWGVLGLGVLVLGAVAWSLLRQLNRQA